MASNGEATIARRAAGCAYLHATRYDNLDDDGFELEFSHPNPLLRHRHPGHLSDIHPDAKELLEQLKKQSNMQAVTPNCLVLAPSIEGPYVPFHVIKLFIDHRDNVDASVKPVDINYKSPAHSLVPLRKLILMNSNSPFKLSRDRVPEYLAAGAIATKPHGEAIPLYETPVQSDRTTASTSKSGSAGSASRPEKKEKKGGRKGRLTKAEKLALHQERVKRCKISKEVRKAKEAKLKAAAAAAAAAAVL